VPGNQYWKRLKDLLVHGPLQALLAAVINISIFNLRNVAIECREFKKSEVAGCNTRH